MLADPARKPTGLSVFSRVQRQRDHRQHGDPRGQDRLGADAGLRGHRRQRRQRRRHRGDRSTSSRGPIRRSASSTIRTTAAMAARCGPDSAPRPRSSSSTPTATRSTIPRRWRCSGRTHGAGRRSGERLQDQPLGSAAPHRHRPHLPSHRQHAVRAEGPRRRLRFPPDAALDLRTDPPREEQRRHLPRDDEEDPGRAASASPKCRSTTTTARSASRSSSTIRRMFQHRPST